MIDLKTKTKKILSVLLSLALLIGTMAAMLTALAADDDPAVQNVVDLITKFRTDGSVAKGMTEQNKTDFDAMQNAYKALTDDQKFAIPENDVAALFGWSHDYYYKDAARLPEGTTKPSNVYDQRNLYDALADADLGRPQDYIDARILAARLIAYVTYEGSSATGTRISSLTLAQWKTIISSNDPTGVKQLFLDIVNEILALDQTGRVRNAFKLLNTTYMTYQQSSPKNSLNLIENVAKSLANLYAAEEELGVETYSPNPHFAAYEKMGSTTDIIKNSLAPLRELSETVQEYLVNGREVTKEIVDRLKAWDANVTNFTQDEQSFMTGYSGAVWSFKLDGAVVTKTPSNLKSDKASIINIYNECGPLIDAVNELELPGTVSDYERIFAMYDPISVSTKILLPQAILDKLDTLRREFTPNECEVDISGITVEEVTYPEDACAKRIDLLFEYANEELLSGMLPSDISEILPYTNESIWNIVKLYQTIYGIIVEAAPDQVDYFSILGLNLTPEGVAAQIEKDIPAKAKLNAAGKDWAKFNWAGIADEDWGFKDANGTAQEFRAGLLEALRKVSKTLSNDLMKWQNTYAYQREAPTTTTLRLYETFLIPLFEELGLDKYLQTSREFTAKWDAAGEGLTGSAATVARSDFFTNSLLDLVMNIANDLFADPITFVLELLPNLASVVTPVYVRTDTNAETGEETKIYQSRLYTLLDHLARNVTLASVVKLYDMLPALDGKFVQDTLQGIINGVFGTTVVGTEEVETTDADGKVTTETVDVVEPNFILPEIDWTYLANIRTPYEAKSLSMFCANRIGYDVKASDSFMVVYRYLFKAITYKDNVAALGTVLPEILASVGMELDSATINLVLGVLPSLDADSALVMILDMLGIENPCKEDELEPPIGGDPTQSTTGTDDKGKDGDLPSTGDKGILVAGLVLAVAAVAVITKRKKVN